MRQRIPLVLSVTALVVALFGATPLGKAARQAIPPLAKHSKTSDYATNAGAVNGIKASKRPRVGWLVPLGAGGKFPASVGQVGPQGAQGEKGEKGDKGDKGDTGAQGPPALSELQIVTADSPNDNIAFTLKEATATCPSGKKVIGGGAQSISSPAASSTGYPVGDNAWKAVTYNSGVGFLGVRAYAVCAKVAG